MTLNVLDKAGDISPHLPSASGGSMAIGGAIGNSPTAGSILYVSSTGTLAQDSTLTFDDVDKQLVLGAGTVGKPSLIFSDDTTGFYRPAANNLAASVSGTLALFLGVSGTLPDSDQVFAVGRMTFDSRTTDRVFLSHRDMTAASSYGFLQRADGTTFLNAASGQSIGLSVNGVNVLAITSTEVTFSKPLKNVAANEQTTVGATGAASALPANPLGYIKGFTSGGTSIAIPYYNA